MTTAELESELEKWQNAVKHSLSTIKWLEQRGDEKTKRIRELEAHVKDLGGTP